MVPSVYVITHEQEVDIWRVSSDLEQLLQVKKLTVNVTAYGHWATDVPIEGLQN